MSVPLSLEEVVQSTSVVGQEPERQTQRIQLKLSSTALKITKFIALIHTPVPSFWAFYRKTSHSLSLFHSYSKQMLVRCGLYPD